MINQQKINVFILLLSCLCIVNSQNCTIDSDCNNGVCVNSTCECNIGYVSYDSDICNYAQKKQITAFLLSFFLGGIGAEWFYLSDCNINYEGLGTLKLILFLIIAILVCVRILDYQSVNYKIGCTHVDIIILILVILWLIWWMSDWIRILNDPCDFKDGNDVCLQ